MKPKLFILALVIAGSLTANSAYSQVHVNVNLGFERDYPGYTYYTYPAWHGHYRDRVYYQHYHPVFERDHRAYFAGTVIGQMITEGHNSAPSHHPYRASPLLRTPLCWVQGAAFSFP